jgi:hypothetical protein
MERTCSRRRFVSQSPERSFMTLLSGVREMGVPRVRTWRLLKSMLENWLRSEMLLLSEDKRREILRCRYFRFFMFICARIVTSLNLL